MKPAHASPPVESARDLAAEIRELITGGKNPPATSRDELLLAQKFSALNQLSGGIAHEFNNIIAGILGSAELANMDISEGHPAHESLKQIFEASNRARDFLHKVRAFSLRPAIELKPTQLQTVVEETIQILRGIIPEKVELHANLNPACPAVHADAAQLHQVLLDLCVHCWHGLQDRRGQITLALEPSAVPSHVSHALIGEQCVRLTVRDSSAGLEKHALAQIFEPFQARKATAKKIGLELFSARETIRAHHGELVAESEPGHGLAFHIYLPIAS
ncbi:MAG: hypothetical protein RL616_1086 [Verrucomicrobiota bacterium]